MATYFSLSQNNPRFLIVSMGLNAEGRYKSVGFDIALSERFAIFEASGILELCPAHLTI